MSKDKTIKKLKTEITSSFSGTIECGRYSNEKPFFAIKEEWEGEVTTDFIKNRQEILHDLCYDKFSEVERKSTIEKILKQRSDLRFYPVGKDFYPSVTSIIGWDKDFFMDIQELHQYGARGTILHAQAQIFLQTGEWKNPQDIPEVYPEYVIVKKGNLNLALDDVDFRSFVSKYPIESAFIEDRVVNHEHKFAGRFDIIGRFQDKVSILDLKTGSSVDRESAFKQMAAYARSVEQPVEQMVVVHLNKNNKCGYSAPIVSDEIDKYFELFLRDRKIFKERFGV